MQDNFCLEKWHIRLYESSYFHAPTSLLTDKKEFQKRRTVVRKGALKSEDVAHICGYLQLESDNVYFVCSKVWWGLFCTFCGTT